MAVKTITIDMEAYEILLKAKKGKESFSKVIKKTFPARMKTARNLLENLESICLSDETLDIVEELVRERNSSMTQSVILSENDE